jgi:hypothetical protein
MMRLDFGFLSTVMVAISFILSVGTRKSIYLNHRTLRSLRASPRALRVLCGTIRHNAFAMDNRQSAIGNHRPVSLSGEDIPHEEHARWTMVSGTRTPKKSNPRTCANRCDVAPGTSGSRTARAAAPKSTRRANRGVFGSVSTTPA